MNDVRQLHEFLVDLMPRLGETVRERFEDHGQVTFKRPGQPVTEVDRAVEDAAREAIAAEFPDHGIEGEEAGVSAGKAAYVWHIDPIDGTMNFVRGIPFFSVSIGVERDGGMVAGAVLDPLRRELFHAWSGGGAWLNDARIRVGEAARLEDAALSMQTSARGEYLLRPGFMSRLHRRCQKTRKLGTIALELAYVACGRLDLLIAGKGKPQAWWDIAGGWALVEEAGGVIADLDAKPLTRESTHLVAGSRAVVDDFLALFHEAD